MYPYRARIDQPSKYHTHHSLHGKVGIAVQDRDCTKFVTLYFTEGDLRSMVIETRAIIKI